MRFDYFGVTQRAKRKYAQVLQPVCEQWGITRNELAVLLFLHNNPEYDRAADIVAHRGMTKSHVSVSVAGLQSRGFLQGRTDPEDRRTVRLQLTGTGEEIARQGREAQTRFFTRLLEGISPEESRLWQSLLERVCDNIDRMDPV